MIENKDRGWEYLNSDGDFDYDPNEDGSWGYQSEDGSSSYYGADGSWGSRNSDGSASYYGADGSWGSRNSDGSSSYYGADGSWGYRNADGSGSFYDADGNSSYYDSNSNEDTDYDSSSGSNSTAEAIGTLIGIGLVAYNLLKDGGEQKRLKENQRRQAEEQKRIRIKEERARKEYEKQIRRAEEKRVQKENARIRRNKRVAFYRRHWKAIIILSFILGVSGFSYNKYNEYQKSIDVGISSSSLIGQNYRAVGGILKKAGFTNIHYNPLYDLYKSDLKKDGIVTDVSIHGKHEFESTSRYPYDSRIKISYHCLGSVNVPMSAESAKKQNYKDIEQAFVHAGFLNIKTVENKDLIVGWFTKDGSVESIKINGDYTFDDNASYRPDAQVVITYHTFK